MDCPDGYGLIRDPAVCEDKADDIAEKGWSKNKDCASFAAIGCYEYSGYLFYSTCDTKRTSYSFAPVCQRGKTS